MFSYPKETNRTSSYIRPVVKIEIGSRSEHWPVSPNKISPYLSKIMNETFGKMEASIRVLDIERTFWEKALILHRYAHFPEGKTVAERQSRHYYDFYCLLNSEFKEKSLKNSAILERVANHNMLYFKAAWANYEMAAKGKIKTVPPSHVLVAMEKDYKLMKEMIFENAPEWKDIIEAVRDFEVSFKL